MRDQLRLVLQPDELVKIKTVTGPMIIAMVSIPALNKTFKAGRCISAFIHCDRNPTHRVALAALLVRRMGRLC
jgi:hypothetical protein